MICLLPRCFELFHAFLQSHVLCGQFEHHRQQHRLPNFMRREHTTGCSSLTNAVEEFVEHLLFSKGKGPAKRCQCTEFIFNTHPPCWYCSTHAFRNDSTTTIFGMTLANASESESSKQMAVDRRIADASIKHLHDGMSDIETNTRLCFHCSSSNMGGAVEVWML